MNTRSRLGSALPRVIAVTGADEQGTFAEFAVHGESTTLAAPSTNIPLVLPANTARDSGLAYSEPGNGTSAATAVVSAAVLVWSAYPGT